MKKAFVMGVLAVVLVMGWGGVAAAEEKVVQVEGMSTLSRADAIRQAMRAAVEEGVGVFVKSESEVQNFALVKDRVLVAVAQRDEKIEKPSLTDLHRVGVAVFIVKMMRSPEGHYHLLVRTSKKLQLLDTVQEEPYLVVRVVPIQESAQLDKQNVYKYNSRLAPQI